MSRPRKPYGPKPPGRLLATMIKVLAAEMSDQGRLSRGKRYWTDDAVIDIVVGHGAVTTEIQGSRPEPYVVTLEAEPGTGIPTKRELWAQCTCPDDLGTGTDLCKHSVAALFALSDEVSIEPKLVDRWRNSGRPPRSELADVSPLRPRQRSVQASSEEPEHDHESQDAQIFELRPRIDSELDKISTLLQAPAGALPPTFPDVERLAHQRLRSEIVGEVLNDALDHLMIRWD